MVFQVGKSSSWKAMTPRLVFGCCDTQAVVGAEESTVGGNGTCSVLRRGGYLAPGRRPGPRRQGHGGAPERSKADCDVDEALVDRGRQNPRNL